MQASARSEPLVIACVSCSKRTQLFSWPWLCICTQKLLQHWGVWNLRVKKSSLIRICCKNQVNSECFLSVSVKITIHNPCKGIEGKGCGTQTSVLSPAHLLTVHNLVSSKCKEKFSHKLSFKAVVQTNVPDRTLGWWGNLDAIAETRPIPIWDVEIISQITFRSNVNLLSEHT